MAITYSSCCGTITIGDTFKIRMEYNDGTPAFEVPEDGTTIVTQADGDLAINNHDVDNIEKMIIGYGMNELGNSFANGNNNNKWKDFDSEVLLSDTLTIIGDSSFSHWQSFNQPFTIPNNITSIGIDAFSYWILFNKSFNNSDNLIIIGNYSFSDWQSFNQPFTIPNKVQIINIGVFAGWYVFNHQFMIPDSVLSIGNSAFGFCYEYQQDFIFTHNTTIPICNNTIFNNWRGNFPARITTPNSTASNSEWKVALTDSYNNGDIESINGVLWADIP